jgi:hypothetical protein
VRIRQVTRRVLAVAILVVTVSAVSGTAVAAQQTSPPSAPTNLRLVAASNGAMTVEWDPVSYPITSYVVQVEPGNLRTHHGTKTTSWTGPTDPVGQTYQVSVRTHSFQGAGRYSAPITVQAPPVDAWTPPGQPRDLRASLNEYGLVRLAWDPPEQAADRIRYYNIVREGCGVIAARVIGTTADFPFDANACEVFVEETHTVSVVAVDDFDHPGPASEPITVKF